MQVKMKKILLLLLMSSSLFAQRLSDLPTTTTGTTSDWLIKNPVPNPGFVTNKISVADFLTTYINPLIPTISGTTNTYSIFTGSSTVGNGLLKDSSSIITTGTSKLLTRVFQVKDGNQGSGKVLTSDASGNATWQTNTAILSGLTTNKYTKATSSSTIGNALLSDDGTNVILPSGKYFTSGNTSKVKLSFGTTGSEWFDLEVNSPVSQNGFHVYSYHTPLGGDGISEIYADGRMASLWRYQPDIDGTYGFFAGGTYGINSDNAGINMMANLSANGLSNAKEQRVALFINAKNSRINAGVDGAVVFGNGRTATQHYTTYFTNINDSGTFVFKDGNQGVNKILGDDGSGTGGVAWVTPSASGITSIATGNGITGGTITTTGTLGLSGATGDIGSFSGTNTYSAISAVSAGSYLRSVAVNTPPVWSTTKLLNAGTANYIPYWTSTNTQGENSLLQFDGTIFTANALKSNASGLYVGANAATAIAPVNIRSDQNTVTGIWVENQNSSTASRTAVVLSNGTASCSFQQIGTGYTTSGIFEQNCAMLRGGNGLNIGSNTGVVKFFIGDATESMRLTSTGLGIGLTPTAYLHLKAGTATASTAPFKFTSGTLLSSPEALAVEALTDNIYYTTTTSTVRKTIDGLAYRAITSARTLDGSDNLINCTSGTFAVTLPTAVGFTGEYIIKNSGTGIITLNTTSSQTVDGIASGVIILAQYEAITLRSNGANWIRNTPALNKPEATLTDAATVAWDVAASPNAVVTIAGDRDLSITNAVNGGYYTLRVIQSGTNRNLSSPANSLGGNGMNLTGGGDFPLSDTSGYIDVITVYYNGTNYFCNLALNYN